MSQKMIRVSEAAYWELKSRCVLARQSVAGVVDDLLRETPVRMEPSQTVREVLAQIPDAPSPPGVAALPASDWRAPAVGVSPAERVLASEIVAKARNGPFSKAAQLGKKA